MPLRAWTARRRRRQHARAGRARERAGRSRGKVPDLSRPCSSAAATAAARACVAPPYAHRTVSTSRAQRPPQLRSFTPCGTSLVRICTQGLHRGGHPRGSCPRVARQRRHGGRSCARLERRSICRGARADLTTACRVGISLAASPPARCCARLAHDATRRLPRAVLLAQLPHGQDAGHRLVRQGACVLVALVEVSPPPSRRAAGDGDGSVDGGVRRRNRARCAATLMPTRPRTPPRRSHTHGRR